MTKPIIKIRYTLIALGVLAMLAFSMPAASAEILDVDELFDELEQIMADEGQPVQISSARVENTVYTSANTGGNTAGSGEIVEGKAEASVYTKTVINGEVVEETDIKEESKDDISVEVENKVEVNGETATVDSTVTIDGEEKASAKTIPLSSEAGTGATPSGNSTPEPLASEAEEEAVIDEEGICSETDKGDCAEVEAENAGAEVENKASATQTNLLVRLWQNLINNIKQSVFKIFSFLV